MRTKDDPIDYKKDFFGLESYLCDSFGQLQGEAMSKIDSNWSKKLEVRSEKKKILGGCGLADVANGGSQLSEAKAKRAAGGAGDARARERHGKAGAPGVSRIEGRGRREATSPSFRRFEDGRGVEERVPGSGPGRRLPGSERRFPVLRRLAAPRPSRETVARRRREVEGLRRRILLADGGRGWRPSSGRRRGR